MFNRHPCAGEQQVTVPLMTAALERILQFERHLLRGAAARTEATDVGDALFLPELPLVHDLNTLIVDRVGADADVVHETVERLYAAFAHRRVRVEPRAASEPVRARLVPAGWSASRHEAMVLRRPADGDTDICSADEVGLDEFTAAATALTLEEPWASPPVAEQLAARLELYAKAVDLRCFVTRDADEVTAGAILLSHDGAAQVDGVQVFERFRGRGYGRAVTVAAVQAAEQDGADLIHLFADAEDWPRDLYQRLGFDVVGGVDLFVRLF
jgi:ribosomal protein S18 acetylase RimI-like enzyme